MRRELVLMARACVRPVLFGLLAALVLVVVGASVADAQPIEEPETVEPVADEPPADGEPEPADSDDEDGDGDGDGFAGTSFGRAFCGLAPGLCSLSLSDIPSPAEALEEIGTAASEGILSVLSKSMTEGLTWMLEQTMGWWIGSSSLIGQEGAVVGLVGSNFAWLGAYLALIGTVWQAGRIAITRSAQAAAGLGGSLVTIALVSSAGWGLVQAVSGATDIWAEAIVTEAIATNGAVENLAVVLATMPDPVAIMFAALVFLAALAQAVLMIARDVAAVVMAGLLPFVASARLFGWGRSWLPKVVNTLISVMLFKPIAAAVMYAAMSLLGQGATVRAIFSGAAMMFLSLLILPALMKTFAFTEVGGVLSGGGGARAISAGVGMAAMAAGAVATGGAGGAAMPPPPRPGPTPPRPGGVRLQDTVRPQPAIGAGATTSGQLSPGTPQPKALPSAPKSLGPGPRIAGPGPRAPIVAGPVIEVTGTETPRPKAGASGAYASGPLTPPRGTK